MAGIGRRPAQAGAEFAPPKTTTRCLMLNFLSPPILAVAANTWIFLLVLGIVSAMVISIILRVLRK